MLKRDNGSNPLKDSAIFVALTLGYFLVSRLELRIPIFNTYENPIWLPAGCAIAAFILFGYRVWPAVLLGSFLGHVSMLGWVRPSFIAPVAATLEGLAGSYLANRFAGGKKAFDTAKGVLLFVLFPCLVSPAVDAVFAFNANFFHWHHSLADSLFLVFQWWLAHSIGVLVLAPFLILVFRGSPHLMNFLKSCELMVLLVGLMAVCLLVFGPLSATLNKDQVIQPWFCVPFLIWAGFRFSSLEAAGTTFILFSSAIWGTMHGYGSFASRYPEISFALLDTFVGVIGTMTLVVAALVAERRQSETELLRVQNALQETVEGMDRELETTIEALQAEVAGHRQARRSLREYQEGLRPAGGEHRSDGMEA